MTPTKRVTGEELEVPERVIVAPTVGVFQPLAPAATEADDGAEPTPDGEGEMVTEGQVVGIVEARGQEHPVRSAFTGFLVGLLAHPGERVREGQPVAWMRVL
ncbi:MAG: hypothetical protein M3N31_03635 [Actinomycetota bacterium]|nr:hypothetical protein [Actinomycetota bacterium]